jgi:lambda family phage portal protein
LDPIGWIKRAIFGGRGTPPSPPQKRSHPTRHFGPFAKYDAAQTGQENSAHWASADALSANAANSPYVRATLRNRSRYEDANNGYAQGLVTDRANYVVGCGPRLQLAFPEIDPDFDRPAPRGLDRAVELLWQDWADLVGLTDHLDLLDVSEMVTGEVFGVAFTNPTLPETGPQLDIKVLEADQVATPMIDPFDPRVVDGIEFDAAGNPAFYHVLKQHPGDALSWAASFQEYDRVPAGRVFHLFTRRRPGQPRGVPALTASLPLYAIQRRYTLATLMGQETGAMIAGVIESDLPGPEDEELTGIEAMDQIPVARNVFMTLNNGAKAKTFDNNKNTTGYKEFKGEVLTEAGRPLSAPRNVSTGSSAEYNYSSGRLDHLPYQLAIKKRRDRIRRVVLDRLFRMWLREAAAIAGYLPAGLPPVEQWRWSWQWDGFQSIDPLKDAKANEVLLASGQTTLMRVCAERGEDWEEVLEQQAREMKRRAELGLTDPAAPPAPAPAPAPASDDDEGDEDA